VRVAGREDRDGVHNLEVMLESLSGGRRREIQEDGLVMEVKKLRITQKRCGQILTKVFGETSCLTATND